MLSSANSSYLSGQVGDTPEVVVTINRPVLSAQEEQEKQLAESIAIVESAAREMHKHMQAQQLVPVLRAACRLFGELRIRTLDPHNYYELYICAFDAAHDALYRYLVEEHTLRGQSLEKLYDVVQSAGAIVPRLYLLILVGAVYMDYGCRDADRNINAARRLEIFGDLLEMCTGVQHPTRGLFLRHFLLTVVKKRLPDDGCPDQPPSSSSPPPPPEKSDAAVRRASRRERHGRDEVDEQHDSAAGDNDDDGEEVVVSRDDCAAHSQTPPSWARRTAELLVRNLREMTWLWIRVELGRGASAAYADAASSLSTNHMDHTHTRHERRLTTGNETGEQNIRAARYHDANAQAVRVQGDGVSGAGHDAHVHAPDKESVAAPSPTTSARPTAVSAPRLPRARRARAELRVLVGMNIVRIAELDGLAACDYRQHILPQLLHVITRYPDGLAQQYLCESMVYVFPDEFHLLTLQPLLETLFRLADAVDVAAVMAALLHRLARFVRSLREGVAEWTAAVRETGEVVVDALPDILLATLRRVRIAARCQMRVVGGSAVCGRRSPPPPHSHRRSTGVPLAAFIDVAHCVYSLLSQLDMSGSIRQEHVMTLLHMVYRAVHTSCGGEERPSHVITSRERVTHVPHAPAREATTTRVGAGNVYSDHAETGCVAQVNSSRADDVNAAAADATDETRAMLSREEVDAARERVVRTPPKAASSSSATHHHSPSGHKTAVDVIHDAPMELSNRTVIRALVRLLTDMLGTGDVEHIRWALSLFDFRALTHALPHRERHDMARAVSEAILSCRSLFAPMRASQSELPSAASLSTSSHNKDDAHAHTSFASSSQAQPLSTLLSSSSRPSSPLHSARRHVPNSNTPGGAAEVKSPSHVDALVRHVCDLLTPLLSHVHSSTPSTQQLHKDEEGYVLFCRVLHSLSVYKGSPLSLPTLTHLHQRCADVLASGLSHSSASAAASEAMVRRVYPTLIQLFLTAAAAASLSNSALRASYVTGSNREVEALGEEGCSRSSTASHGVSESTTMTKSAHSQRIMTSPPARVATALGAGADAAGGADGGGVKETVVWADTNARTERVDHGDIIAFSSLSTAEAAAAAAGDTNSDIDRISAAAAPAEAAAAAAVAAHTVATDAVVTASEAVDTDTVVNAAMASRRVTTAPPLVHQDNAMLDFDSVQKHSLQTCPADAASPLWRHMYHGNGSGLLEVLTPLAPRTAYYLYLAAARTADGCAACAMSDTLLTEALTVYEDYAAPREEAVEMLCTMMNTLLSLTRVTCDNYDRWASRVCQCASRLLRRADQACTMARCAHMFTHPMAASMSAQERVVRCLTRARATAELVPPREQLAVYAELLPVFLHFSTAAAHRVVSVAQVNDLLRAARARAEAESSRQLPHLQQMTDAEVTQTVRAYAGEGGPCAAAQRTLLRTMAFIHQQRARESTWSSIEI